MPFISNSSVKKSSIKDVALAMRRDFQPGSHEKLGRTLLLVGAGCSFSAGIPLAGEIAQQLVMKLANSYFQGRSFENPSAAASELMSHDHLSNDNYIKEIDQFDWSAVYDELFTRHYRTPKEVRRVFLPFLEKIGNRINWAHLSIGELVRLGYIPTVLTTNFDQLVLEGIARTGPLPVVADGLESLYRITGHASVPQLIQIHGSRHTYYLRNSTSDTDALMNDNSARHAVGELFREASIFIVVGYGGREKGLMSLLIEAGNRFPDTQIFWVSHSESERDLSNQTIKFLDTSRFSSVVFGQDADNFFLDLTTKLNCCPPILLQSPINGLRNLHDELVFSKNDRIAQLIKEYQDKVSKIENSWDAVVTSKEENSSASQRLRSLEGATILLVEDEDAVRSFASRALLSRGYNVIEAKNGREALRIFKLNPAKVAIICTDVHMPNMDGFILFDEIKKLDRSVPFVFISGYADEGIRKHRSIPEGARYLPKPYSLKQLVSIIKETLVEQ